MGISCIGLSFYYRIPVLTAWSTPGAALLITSLGNFTLAEAIGAFVISSLLITLCGISGWFDRLIAEFKLPEGWNAFLLDETGNVLSYHPVAALPQAQPGQPCQQPFHLSSS